MRAELLLSLATFAITVWAMPVVHKDRALLRRSNADGYPDGTWDDPALAAFRDDAPPYPFTPPRQVAPPGMKEIVDRANAEIDVCWMDWVQLRKSLKKNPIFTEEKLQRQDIYQKSGCYNKVSRKYSRDQGVPQAYLKRVADSIDQANPPSHMSNHPPLGPDQIIYPQTPGIPGLPLDPNAPMEPTIPIDGAGPVPATEPLIPEFIFP